MIKRSTLRPGDLVQNKISGHVGTVRGKGTKLMVAHKDYVRVELRRQSGVTRGQKSYITWALKNLQFPL